MNVADFHCDLLSYLADDPAHTAHDPASRASIPLLKAGGVVLQTLAIYTKTEPGSAKKGVKQAEVFFELSQKYPVFGKEIKTIVSIENASGICEENEPLKIGLERLDSWFKKAGRIAYISLTWNDENRFGGGNASAIGLKEDGREILRWMDGKKIAIDLSHTSDRLAEDILEAIENLDIIPVASHSNFRKISNHPRNLPDHLAKEIGARGGVIGLNFVRTFLGHDVDGFIRQTEHADKLGLLDHFCFGADFFADSVLPPERQYLLPMFNPGFDSAACYREVIELLGKHLSRDIVEKIAYKNLIEFLK
jgi:microsomal dipeptidase-like Zn-dependent dipeptidase